MMSKHSIYLQIRKDLEKRKIILRTEESKRRALEFLKSTFDQPRTDYPRKFGVKKHKL